MRDSSRWHGVLLDQIKSDVISVNRNSEHEDRNGTSNSAGARLFCDVELALTLISAEMPKEPVAVVPALLSAQELPALRKARENPRLRRRLAVARHLLSQFLGYNAWTSALQFYQGIEKVYRLYRVTGLECPPQRRSVSVCPHREKVYLDALDASPDHRAISTAYAEPEQTYYFQTGDLWNPISIDGSQLPAGTDPQHQDLFESRNREPLKFTMSELRETALRMDQLTTEYPRLWEQRFDGIDLRDKDNERLDEIFINGTANAIGSLGTGKTTLSDVLAIHAADRGLRTTIVVGNNVESISRATEFGRLGYPSVPLMDSTDREGHRRQIYGVVAAKHSSPLLQATDHRLRWFSTVCRLRNYSTGDRHGHIEPGREPCHALYDQPNQRSKRNSCPLISVCPVHKAWAEMHRAAIWVTTVQALISTRVPHHITDRDVRLLEAAYHWSDLIILDEADLTQVNLDGTFGPNDTLVDESQRGFLDQLGRDAQPTRSLSQAINSTTNRQWFSATNTLQSVIGDIVHELDNDVDLQEWVSDRNYFSALTLFRQIYGELIPCEGKIGDIPEKVTEFLRNPFQQDSELSDLAHRLNHDYNSERSDALAARFLNSIVDTHPAHYEDRLKKKKVKLAVSVAVLDHQLKEVIDNWPAVLGSAQFEISAEDASVFQRPPRDYGPLMPSSPISNILGFRYTPVDRDQNRPSRLEYFRLAGNGRWLIHHLHDLFDPLDGVAGPNVLLLSGTSYAPGSSSYHVQIAPAFILKHPRYQIEAIKATSISFDAPPDPEHQNGNGYVTVSGTYGDRRLGNVKRIVQHLAADLGIGRSLLDQELAKMFQRDPRRQKILLATNSYHEVNAAWDAFAQDPSWRGRVCRMVRDRDEDYFDEPHIIPRGLVGEFATREEQILIAPVGAIERGHNIVLDDGTAAIASVYFLTRPMPVPHDLNRLIRHMNWWAMEEWHRIESDSSLIRDEAAEFQHRAWRRWYWLLSQQEYYASLDPEGRQALIWSVFIPMWQVVGRAVRGGSAVSIHLVDGAFAPPKGTKATPENSLLHGIRNMLNNLDPVGRMLYDPIIPAFQHIQNID